MKERNINLEPARGKVLLSPPRPQKMLQAINNIKHPEKVIKAPMIYPKIQDKVEFNMSSHKIKTRNLYDVARSRE